MGDISLVDLGIYYASQEFQDISYNPGQDFQDIDSLALPVPLTGGRTFNKGLSLSAQISIGRIKLFDWLEKSDEENAVPPANKVPEEVIGTTKAKEELPSILTTRWVKIDKISRAPVCQKGGLGL